MAWTWTSSPRAAFPRPRRIERSASTVVKRSSAVSTVTPSGSSNSAQGRRLVEGRLGRRADLAGEAQRQPHHDGQRLDLAHGVDHGGAVPCRVTAALNRPPGAGQLRPLSL